MTNDMRGDMTVDLCSDLSADRGDSPTYCLPSFAPEYVLRCTGFTCRRRGALIGLDRQTRWGVQFIDVRHQANRATAVPTPWMIAPSSCPLALDFAASAIPRN